MEITCYPPPHPSRKMAASQEMNCEFVEVPPAELTCPICLKVLCQPHLVNCCGQQYCEKCLKQWQGQNESCPHCRSTGYAHMLMKQTIRKVGELKLYCPNKKHGCLAIVKVSEYNAHLGDPQGCQYVEMKCSYLCNSTVFRCHMADHQAYHCVRRPFSCTYCKLHGEYQNIVSHHISTCPSYPLPCPRSCGATAILRKNLEAHRARCPLETVPCPFTNLGCKVEIHRRDLQHHMDSNSLHHMTAIANSHLSLKDEHTALQTEFAKLKTDHTALKTDHTTLKTDYMTLKTDHTVLKTSHADLKAENAELQKRLNAS